MFAKHGFASVLNVETLEKPNVGPFGEIAILESKNRTVPKKPKAEPLTRQCLQRYLVFGRQRTDDRMLGNAHPKY